MSGRPRGRPPLKKDNNNEDNNPIRRKSKRTIRDFSFSNGRMKNISSCTTTNNNNIRIREIKTNLRKNLDADWTQKSLKKEFFGVKTLGKWKNFDGNNSSKTKTTTTTTPKRNKKRIYCKFWKIWTCYDR